MEIRRTRVVGYSFSEDLLVEILSRLPVKTLLGFRCVSKAWYALINSSCFIAVHLHRSNPNLSLLLRETSNPKYEISLLAEEATPLSLDLSFLNPINMSFNITSIDIVGSSNGLVCLSASTEKDGTKIIVWNPSTTEFRCLPKPTNCEDCEPILGFGFVGAMSEYKLVRILKGYKGKEGFRAKVIFEVQVFTRSTNSWREVEAFSLCETEAIASGFFPVSTYESITLNGVLYWLLQHTKPKCVLSFDLFDDVFRVIPLPSGRSFRLFRFLPWKNSLAFVVAPKNQFYDFWVMNEEYEAGSKQMPWTRQFRIECSFVGLENLFGVWKDQFLFEIRQEYGEELFLRDPTSQRKVKLRERDEQKSHYLKAANYVESLLPV